MARICLYGTNTSGQTESKNIIAITETTAAITPDNNTEYRCGEVTSVTITLPEDMPDDYAAYIVFIPIASRRYNIGIWYDGVNVNAVARGAGV